MGIERNSCHGDPTRAAGIPAGIRSSLRVDPGWRLVPRLTRGYWLISLRDEEERAGAALAFPSVDEVSLRWRQCAGFK